MVEVFRDITAEIQSRLVIEQQVVERTKELLEKNAALAAAKEEINHAWQQIQLEKTQFLASINSISIGFVMFNDVGKVLHLNPAFSKIVNAKQPFATVNEIDVLLGNAFSIKEKFEKCRSTEQKIDISGIEINGKDYSVHLAPIFATDNSFTVIGVVLLIEA